MAPIIATRRNRTARGRNVDETVATFHSQKESDDALFHSQDLA